MAPHFWLINCALHLPVKTVATSWCSVTHAMSCAMWSIERKYKHASSASLLRGNAATHSSAAFQPLEVKYNLADSGVSPVILNELVTDRDAVNSFLRRDLHYPAGKTRRCGHQVPRSQAHTCQLIVKAAQACRTLLMVVPASAPGRRTIQESVRVTCARSIPYSFCFIMNEAYQRSGRHPGAAKAHSTPAWSSARQRAGHSRRSRSKLHRHVSPAAARRPSGIHGAVL